MFLIGCSRPTKITVNGREFEIVDGARWRFLRGETVGVVAVVNHANVIGHRRKGSQHLLLDDLRDGNHARGTGEAQPFRRLELA